MQFGPWLACALCRRSAGVRRCVQFGTDTLLVDRLPSHLSAGAQGALGVENALALSLVLSGQCGGAWVLYWMRPEGGHTS